MATWRPENSMLTQRGVEILNKLKAGVGSITVTRVVAGSGRVAESLLYQQTSISGVQKPMTISAKNTTDVGSEITFYIENKDFTEPYNLHQIGIYVTHPDYVGEQLYHISQCDANDYDTIPAISYTPVTQGYSVFMEHGNSSSVNITVDPSGMVNTVQFNEFKESTNSLINTLINSSKFQGYMITFNDFIAPICADDDKSFVITDDDGNVIVSNWKYSIDTNIEEEKEEPTSILIDKVTGCMYRKFGGITEWINPPMFLGIEYRTTERYMGKPVYVKAIDFGALPNTTKKHVDIDNQNHARAIRVSGLLNNGATIPGTDENQVSNEKPLQCYGYNNNVCIYAPYDASIKTAVVTAWYTKITD